eukprot:scaffold1988_cov255-Pinguiococcus_pyrenoidosus.AAC.6
MVADPRSRVVNCISSDSADGGSDQPLFHALLSQLGPRKGACSSHGERKCSGDCFGFPGSHAGLRRPGKRGRLRRGAGGGRLLHLHSRRAGGVRRRRSGEALAAERVWPDLRRVRGRALLWVWGKVPWLRCERCHALVLYRLPAARVSYRKHGGVERGGAEGRQAMVRVFPAARQVRLCWAVGGQAASRPRRDGRTGNFGRAGLRKKKGVGGNAESARRASVTVGYISWRCAIRTCPKQENRHEDGQGKRVHKASGAGN